ncbi:carboxypeptidase M32 [Halobacillus salinarum]|uniref:Metal-dependent carboxypeptidase n=1 Tax=Halobacillus salinarum TaxID=2932257 RepID=A0ABY4EF13_9BACI|nr:carboxypeptidase M32 [Halobacillus salinarum]UOQ42751.1 carboxypeptidase M32 [Halobacillus salinarum]
MKEQERYMDLLKEQMAYKEAIGLMAWDMRTKAPIKGMDNRAEVIGVLSQKVHQLQTSEEMKHLIESLKGRFPDSVTEKALLESEEDFERTSKIPIEEYRDYVTLQSKAEAVWGKAKDESDFASFQPYLEKLVEYNQTFAEYWGYKNHPYDALLHNYEPGITVKKLDQVFPDLKAALTELLNKIKKADEQPDPSILRGHFPKEQQAKFSKEILARMGYDFEAGRLDETVHPFAIGLNVNDVRVTTKYDEEDFRTAVFGTIHEGGHALYEQNISPELSFTPLATGTSMGIHESQSLFWENFVARSESFWQNHYHLFQKYAPAHFKDVPLTDFFKAVNEVKPSYIRIEADELTYCLHIMIRYELEKALISGEIKVKDLPLLWNEKMRDYLGITPRNDAEGVLQDIHWAGGDFGYFPSYALGYMYAAQFNASIRKELDVDRIIQAGEFNRIKQWLASNIHRYGKMKKPLEILEDVTKERLNPKYLVDYLSQKYQHIYKF